MSRLSSAEIEHYRQEGWLIPQYRLPEDQIKSLVEALNELLRRNPGVRPEKLVSAHVDVRVAQTTVKAFAVSQTFWNSLKIRTSSSW